ncbi:MAG TPA: M23 family metallopeptidase [Candidatus Limnocylindria bacterium]|nr:M23 family metallopeptidase [Candidatus Limnocylindria bacterium]
MDRTRRCAIGWFLAAALVAACEPVPTGQASASPPAPAPAPTGSPRGVAAPTPPNGPDALVCTDRVALPPIADAIGVAWSPNGRTLAIDHMVALPSARITGSPEEFFLDALDLPTGELTPLGVGERQQWSGSGTYLSYWSWDGDLRIVIGGRVIDLPRATIPDARWVGDTLYYFAKDELRSWTDGNVRTLSRLPAGVVPTYPADDASFSADAERFLITRYSLDGTVRRYAGVTRTGTVTELDLPDATYTEWAPTGQALLVRYPDRIEIREGDTVRSAPLSRSAGPVHQWTPDGRSVLLGAVTPTVSADITFDPFAAFGAGTPSPTATLPNLIGARGFSPDGRYFAGDSRTALRSTRLELFRCGTGGSAKATPIPAGAAFPPTGLRYLRPAVGAITQLITPSHTGIDIAAPLGSILVASDDGVVTAVGWVAVGGRRVCVGHPSGIETCDYHTSAALVRTGDRVVRGQAVALVGLTGVTTGPHVHWEAKVGTRVVDPLTR